MAVARDLDEVGVGAHELGEVLRAALAKVAVPFGRGVGSTLHLVVRQHEEGVGAAAHVVLELLFEPLVVRAVVAVAGAGCCRSHGDDRDAVDVNDLGGVLAGVVLEALWGGGHAGVVRLVVALAEDHLGVAGAVSVARVVRAAVFDEAHEARVLVGGAVVGQVAYQAERIELGVDGVDGVKGKLQLFVGVAGLGARVVVDVQVAAEQEARLDALARKAGVVGPGNAGGTGGVGCHEAEPRGHNELQKAAAREAAAGAGLGVGRSAGRGA